ncbi:hypothetical protein [Bacillus sp. FJAT-27251]|uniref:hypothetical protein n=1 Tax=Bacillus sp. FJAT-27251 TaxID=1684142 RepID=UPI0006A7E548|nr:hypothetical protein [Bacillus sp. FJAT-27251]
MFLGVNKTELNQRAINYLENLVVDFDTFRSRLILFGKDPETRTRLAQDVLTILNSQNRKTKYIHINQIINDEISFSKITNLDLVVIDGLLDKKSINEEHVQKIGNLLNVLQHSTIFITCSLASEEVFSEEIRNYFDNGGVRWSRNFLGCKQLFLDDSERSIFIHYLNNEPKGDYRIIQSIDFLSKEIPPFNQLSFLNHSIINDLISKGNDDYHNSLVITSDRKVQLMPFSQVKVNREKIAVQLEAFMAGNGYVGCEPSNSELNQYFTFLLHGYHTYLKTKKPVFVDNVNATKMNYDIIREIKKEHFLNESIYL